MNTERGYYLLEQDLRIPDLATVGGVPASFEPLDWLKGEKRAPPGPLCLTLHESSSDQRSDLMGGLVTLFSDELKDALTEYGVDTVDYFPVELEDPRTHEREAGYWLANVLRRVACLDTARSTIVPRPSGARGRLESFYVDPSRADGQPLFRLAEEPTLIVIDAELRAYLQEGDLAGIRLRHTKSYDGY